MTQTAIITGVNGFVGMHLARRLLSAGWNVTGVVHRHRDQAERILKPQDITESPTTTAAAIALLARITPDAIFHLASASTSDLPAEVDHTITSNVVVGAVLLEAASRLASKPRFIIAGSFWEYADGRSYSPNTLYAATKHALHDLLIYYRNRHDLHAVSLVLFDTYGPDDHRNKLWNKLLHAEPGTRIDLTPGEQLVDLVHIHDVVSAFLCAAELLSANQLPEAAYAVSAIDRQPLRFIAEAICQLTDNPVHLEWGKKSYRSTEIFTPWSGPRLPGWSPLITLEQGILELSSPLSNTAN